MKWSSRLISSQQNETFNSNVRKNSKKNLICRISYIIIIGCLCYTSTAQPTLSATTSKSTIRTGEPDTIQLTADWPGHSLKQGFTIPDSFPHFEVWDKGSAIINENGFTQKLVVTSYDSGRFSLPPLELAEMKNSKTDSLLINVEPVNVDSLKDYHDIKDIIEVPSVAQWPFVFLIAALTIISLLVLYFLLRKTRLGKEKTTGKASKAGAYNKAIEALQKLELQAQQNGMAKPFYVSLTNIYRNYLQEAYRYRSLQQTGGELIIQAKPLLNENDFYQLANTIRLSDAVKFAKYEPPQNDWMTSLNSIRNSIEALENKITSNKIQETGKQENKKSGIV